MHFDVDVTEARMIARSLKNEAVARDAQGLESRIYLGLAERFRSPVEEHYAGMNEEDRVIEVGRDVLKTAMRYARAEKG